MRTINTFRTLAVASVCLASLTFTACNKKEKSQNLITKDHVYSGYLKDVRLGDGIPLSIGVSVRYKIMDQVKFTSEFDAPSTFDSLVLAPRELELANKIANKYHNVDSVFTVLRPTFINEIKDYFASSLGEQGIEIKEVIISEVVFPQNYTSTMERLALQKQELESIRKQAAIDLERSIAERSQAEEDGKVEIARAEMDAKVQKINAETEKSTRINRMEQAETEKQVAKSHAEADAERIALLAKVELAKQKEMKELDAQHQRNLDKVAIQKQQDLEELAFSKDIKMAKLCSDNPTYANYIVNKELASKVQIAVLPNNQDGTVFSNLLKSTTPR